MNPLGTLQLRRGRSGKFCIRCQERAGIVQHEYLDPYLLFCGTISSNPNHGCLMAANLEFVTTQTHLRCEFGPGRRNRSKFAKTTQLPSNRLQGPPTKAVRPLVEERIPSRARFPSEDMADAVEAVPAVATRSSQANGMPMSASLPSFHPCKVRDKGFDTCDIRHLRKLKYHFQVWSGCFRLPG